MDNRVDIKENQIVEIDKSILAILLKDHSSGKNIIWATDNYVSKGSNYQSFEQITIEAITGRNGSVIKPRTTKSKQVQLHRVKDKAEVFTPSWICNNQNNLVDNAWFGRENVFNIEQEKTWQTNENKIVFPDSKTWQDYVKSNRLEISCGEAPYLVSRYDTVTGEWIELNDRIGLLDRKIRIVNENTSTNDEWLQWVIEAYKAIYGFEWQGDSLLIARENLLFTFTDYYQGRFNEFPKIEILMEIAKIISWNIWQMDGLKYVIPDSCKPTPKLQQSIFELLGEAEEQEPCQGCINGNNKLHTGIYCKIMDWDTGKAIRFVDILKEKK